MKIDKQYFYVALVVLALIAIVSQGLMIDRLQRSVAVHQEVIDEMRKEHNETIEHCDSMLNEACNKIKDK